LIVPLPVDPVFSSTTNRVVLKTPAPGATMQGWTVTIGAPGTSPLVLGTYESTVAQGTPFQAALEVNGDFGLCFDNRGRLEILDVAFDGARVVRLRARFQQTCGAADPMHGEIWYAAPNSNSTTSPPGSPAPLASAACPGPSPGADWACLDNQWLYPGHPSATTSGAVLMDAPLRQNFLRLRSDAQDTVGEGWTYLLQVPVQPPALRMMGNAVELRIPDTRGREWTLTMTPPGGARLDVGTYVRTLGRANAFQLGLQAHRFGSSCAGLGPFGRVRIEDIAFDGARVTKLKATFELRCSMTSGTGLSGELWYAEPSASATPAAGDPDRVIGGTESLSCPGRAPGAGWVCGDYVWLPPEHVLAQSGYARPIGAPQESGFAWFDSEANDRAGGGWTHLLRLDPSPSAAQVSGAIVTFQIPAPTGDTWRVRLEAPARGQLRTGIYRDTRDRATAFHAGLDVSGPGSCSSPIGELIVKDIAFTGSTLTRLRASFEQRCSANAPKLVGEVWFGGPGPATPEPLVPILPSQSVSCQGNSPGEGWLCVHTQWLPPGHPQAVSGTLPGPPTQPGFVWIESQPGEPTGAGWTHLLQLDSSSQGVQSSANAVTFRLPGTQGDDWAIEIGAPAVTPLVTGVYSRVRTGQSVWDARLVVSGVSRCFDKIFGRVVVKDIAFTSGQLTRFRATFEQRCGSPSAPLLRGEIWFGALPPPGLPGPVLSEVVADASRSCLGRAPASDWLCGRSGQWLPHGHPIAVADDAAPIGPPTRPGFAWIQSDNGDSIGGGFTHLLQLDPRPSAVTSSTQSVSIAIPSTQGSGMTLSIRAPTGQTLRAGTYESTSRFGSVTQAGLDFFGDSRGCSQSFGRLVIMDIAFDGTTLTRLRAQFEQRCGLATAPLLVGEIWYVR
jgi:hypothetical protein